MERFCRWKLLNTKLLGVSEYYSSRLDEQMNARTPNRLFILFGLCRISKSAASMQHAACWPAPLGPEPSVGARRDRRPEIASGLGPARPRRLQRPERGSSRRPPSGIRGPLDGADSIRVAYCCMNKMDGGRQTTILATGHWH